MTKREKLHDELCGMLSHAEKYGDWSKILLQLKGMPTGVTFLNIVKWIEKYSPYVVKFSEGKPVRIIKHGNIFTLEQAKLNPYWKTEFVESTEKKFISEFDIISLDVKFAFNRFLVNPTENNHTYLLDKLDSYRGSISKRPTVKYKPKKIYVRVVQGGIYGLGKSRKH